MIVKNGREVYPLRIKKILLGDKLIYYRSSKAEVEHELELDMEALLRGTPTVPVEMQGGYALTLDPDMVAVLSGLVEAKAPVDIDMETELYVHLTAPMYLTDPLNIVLNPEANAPATAPCEMDETLPIDFYALANAPTAIPCETEESVDTDMEVEAKAADTARMDIEAGVLMGIESEAKAAPSAVLDGGAESTVEPEGELSAPVSVPVTLTIGPVLEIEAELWIKPCEWTDPVLLNNVLGITQVMDAVQIGSTLKLYPYDAQYSCLIDEGGAALVFGDTRIALEVE